MACHEWEISIIFGDFLDITKVGEIIFPNGLLSELVENTATALKCGQLAIDAIGRAIRVHLFEAGNQWVVTRVTGGLAVNFAHATITYFGATFGTLDEKSTGVVAVPSFGVAIVASVHVATVFGCVIKDVSRVTEMAVKIRAHLHSLGSHGSHGTTTFATTPCLFGANQHDYHEETQ